MLATIGCTRAIIIGGHARRGEDELCIHALACCGVRVVLPAGDGETPDLLKFSRRVLKKYIKKKSKLKLNLTYATSL